MTELLGIKPSNLKSSLMESVDISLQGPDRPSKSRRKQEVYSVAAVEAMIGPKVGSMHNALTDVIRFISNNKFIYIDLKGEFPKRDPRRQS